jgi:hypothetical protein
MSLPDRHPHPVRRAGDEDKLPLSTVLGAALSSDERDVIRTETVEGFRPSRTWLGQMRALLGQEPRD